MNPRDQAEAAGMDAGTAKPTATVNSDWAHATAGELSGARLPVGSPQVGLWAQPWHQTWDHCLWLQTSINSCLGWQEGKEVATLLEAKASDALARGQISNMPVARTLGTSIKFVYRSQELAEGNSKSDRKEQWSQGQEEVTKMRNNTTSCAHEDTYTTWGNYHYNSQPRHKKSEGFTSKEMKII